MPRALGVRCFDGLGNGRHERITLPGDLLRVAQDSEQELGAPASEVRALLPSFAVPYVVASLEQLRASPLEPRDAYLISLADGYSSLRTIADVTAIPLEDVVEAFARFLRLGVVDLRDPR
jgi:hypothetical protein